MGLGLAFHDLLHHLAERRPIFHSEADFQHALAWEIQTHYENSDIRLELRPNADVREHVDIWVVLGGERYAIELKYKTRQLSVQVKGEAFSLANQAAQDLARYDFLRDVERLERMVAEGAASYGAAVFLTNDQGYWAPSDTRLRVDEAFRIGHGRSVTGTLSWGQHASPGTTKGRERSLTIAGSYSLEWHDYSRVSSTSAGSFRYALVDVAVASSSPDAASA